MTAHVRHRAVSLRRALTDANASGGGRYDPRPAAYCRIIPPSIIRT